MDIHFRISSLTFVNRYEVHIFRQISRRKISMATTPELRVIFFDVFGTCVAQRTPVADELWRAAREALESDVSSISSEVRIKATKMVCPAG